jgi:hypothetical protein
VDQTSLLEIHTTTPAANSPLVIPKATAQKTLLINVTAIKLVRPPTITNTIASTTQVLRAFIYAPAFSASLPSYVASIPRGKHPKNL